jgi:decaprenyl-phosphate phosphoribosyltransferase
VCNGTNLLTTKSAKQVQSINAHDLKITDSSYSATLPLVTCRDCDFVFAPQSKQIELVPLYAEMVDSDFVATEEGRQHQARTFFKKILQIKPEASSLLDIGAAAGLHLDIARSLGLECVGVEPSRQLAGVAQKAGHKVLLGGFPEVRPANQKFDIVLLSDVIEHVSDPYALLAAAKEHCNESGIVVVATPNVSSLAARLTGKSWWHYRKAHVSYFNKSTFNRLAERVGLKSIFDFSPTWFFPVWYLSERLRKYTLLKPMAALFSLASKDSVLPINLFDSFCSVLTHARISHDPKSSQDTGSKWKSRLSVARPDHWIKNIFVLPGMALGFALQTDFAASDLFVRSFFGLIAMCIAASANYTINEYLDADSDRSHPDKFLRPFAQRLLVRKDAITQWALLAAIAVGSATAVSVHFFYATIALLVMGLIYNVPPVRTKDFKFLDALSESVNNPIRMLAGWYIVKSSSLPPLTLIISYWMLGAFMMSLKRFAEHRMFSNNVQRIQYRLPLGTCTSVELITASAFYGMSAMSLFGAFCMRYRPEALVSLPALTLLMSYYFKLAFDDHSSVQAPEKLYKDRRLLLLTALCAAILCTTIFSDRNWFAEFAVPSMPKLSPN